MQIMYKMTINVTKLSICLMLLRMVDRTNANYKGLKVKPLCYVVLAYVVSFGIASVLVTIFQCSPIDRAWDHSHPGSCINLTSWWYAGAGLNVFGDVVVWLLPFPLLMKLQTRPRDWWFMMVLWALMFL